MLVICLITCACYRRRQQQKLTGTPQPFVPVLHENEIYEVGAPYTPQPLASAVDVHDSLCSQRPLQLANYMDVSKNDGALSVTNYMDVSKPPPAPGVDAIPLDEIYSVPFESTAGAEGTYGAYGELDDFPEPGGAQEYITVPRIPSARKKMPSVHETDLDAPATKNHDCAVDVTEA